MAQELRTFAIFPEDLGSIPSTNMAAPAIYSSSSRALHSVLAASDSACMCGDTLE